MSTVPEIEKMIEKLSPGEFAELARWMDEYRKTPNEKLPQIYYRNGFPVSRGAIQITPELVDEILDDTL